VQALPPLTNSWLILKKTANPKRADPPRLANYTKVFLKDWQRLSHSGRYDMTRLKEADHRECHIGGDFLLIYQVLENRINFVRAGTHSELFSV